VLGLREEENPMSRDYERFLKDAAAPTSLRCTIHDSTYSPGGSCYYCRTGYEPKDIGKDSMPMLDRPRLRTGGPLTNWFSLKVGLTKKGEKHGSNR
jgi:hypothetical protein